MAQPVVTLTNFPKPQAIGSVVTFQELDSGTTYRVPNFERAKLLFRNDGNKPAEVVIQGRIHRVSSGEVADDLVLEIPPGEYVECGPLKSADFNIANGGLRLQTDRPVSLTLRKTESESLRSGRNRLSRGRLVRMQDTKRRAWKAA